MRPKQDYKKSVHNNNFVVKPFRLKNLYLFYPYKKATEKIGNTIPLPYVKKSEDTNHEFSISLSEWEDIINVYLEELTKFLIDGNIYDFSSSLGSILLAKSKIFVGEKPVINWYATNKVNKKLKEEDKEDKKKVIFFNNLHYYYVKLYWRKPNVYYLKLYKCWQLHPSIYFNKRIIERRRKDANIIDKYIDKRHVNVLVPK